LAQQDSFTLVRTYRGDVVNAAMDNLDNLYIISSTGQVRKFNANGDSVGVYNQFRNFGQLFSIDVSNPLKLLLFYKDFSTVVVLDRYLASLATLDLRRFSILQPAAVGLSYDNNIWVFDEYDNKLKKIDEQGNRLLETSDLRSVFNQGIAPQKIINDNGLVYVADTAAGVFVFDNYGSFKKKILLKNWQNIAVNSNNLIGVTHESITVYNTSTQLQTQRKPPVFRPYVHAFATSSKFVRFSTDSLQIYRFHF
jgi:hypothetical protein